MKKFIHWGVEFQISLSITTVITMTELDVILLANIFKK